MPNRTDISRLASAISGFLFSPHFPRLLSALFTLHWSSYFDLKLEFLTRTKQCYILINNLNYISQRNIRLFK